jgi:hypothetical protein
MVSAIGAREAVQLLPVIVTSPVEGVRARVTA